jgi:hypothetical protein
VALCAAVIALATHLLAIAGAAPLGMGVIVLVFPVAFICFGAFILAAKRETADQGSRRLGVFKLLEPFPSWARVLFAVVFLYAGINFALFFRATGGGAVDQQADGRVVLTDHGRFIRELDDRGVRDLEVWQVRLFSGHILPFLVLPGLYFLFAPRRAPQGEGTPPMP